MYKQQIYFECMANNQPISNTQLIKKNTKLMTNHISAKKHKKTNGKSKRNSSNNNKIFNKSQSINQLKKTIQHQRNNKTEQNG